MLAIDRFEPEFRIGHVHQSERAVVCDVKVEKAISIDVADGQRHAAFAEIQARGKTEFAFAIVEENVRACANGIDDEVEVAVAIEIDESGASAVDMGEGDAGLSGDVFKFPVAEIAVEHVVSAHAAEIEIAPAIAIHVAGGDAGAVKQDLVCEMAFDREQVGKVDTRSWRREQRKARFSVGWDGELGHAKIALVGPLKGDHSRNVECGEQGGNAPQKFHGDVHGLRWVQSITAKM